MKSGDTFAHYEIIGPIGAGAMGEVFSARDTRLGREVAVKVLPADFAADPERLARFRREARTLAALNHPNIAAIHGLEEEDGKIFLAMELAPGETLEARINRGPMPTEDALAVAIQVAAGLEEAHSKGIVHRDLKPANVKLGPEGGVKILDFGLARAYLGDDGTAADPGSSPTMTAAMTREGVILGTAAYMSPEQARGFEVDERTDIWAFGVVLWELLAGRRLFAGETATDILAMVLRSDPDWSALPADLSPSLRRLLQRCLQRDKRQRMHHIADARIVMEEILQDGTSAHEPAAGSIMAMNGEGRRRARTGWIASAVMAVVAAVLGWQTINREAPAPPKSVHFDLSVPEGKWLAGQRQLLAISPAGDLLVVSLKTDQGTQLYSRAMDELAMEPIPGTEDVESPFFSPDGRWLGFTKNGKLRKALLEGGTPSDICEAGWGGGTWTQDDRIVFTRSYSTGLFLVSAAGGEPQPLTTPDPEFNELGHWWPQVLPDDEWVIYTGYSTPIQNARIMAFSLKSGETRVLAEGGTFGRWSPTGHLLFVRENKLLAASFDRKQMVLTGSPEPVLDDVYMEVSDGYSPLVFGANGTLVYAADSVLNAPRKLTWVDLQGGSTPVDLPADHYTFPSLSPDGRRIAVTVAEGNNSDIWIYDRERGTSSRFTFSPTSDQRPVWTPDGKSLIYNGEEPQYTIYRRPADGSAKTQLILKKPVDTTPTSVSPDGKWLVFNESQVPTGSDLWLLPLDGDDGEPKVFLATDFGESAATFSPDGKWLAYQSDESGRPEVYVMSFPEGGSRVQISIAGGRQPAWSPQGDRLFFLGDAGMMAVTVDRQRTTDTDLVVSRPQALFGDFNWTQDTLGSVPAMSLDGQSFLVAITPDESQPRSLRVIVNWFSELAGTD